MAERQVPAGRRPNRRTCLGPGSARRADAGVLPARPRIPDVGDGREGERDEGSVGRGPESPNPGRRTLLLDGPRLDPFGPGPTRGVSEESSVPAKPALLGHLPR